MSSTIKMGDAEVKHFQNMMKVAKLLNLEILINESEIFRGHVDGEGIVMVCPKPANISKYEYNTLAINRIPELIARMNLLGEDLDIILHTKEMEIENSSRVDHVEIKAKGKSTRVKNRCTSVQRVTNVPKSFKDPIHHAFYLEKDSIDLLARCISAMKSHILKFEGSEEDGIILKMKDVIGDELSHDVYPKMFKVDDNSADEFGFNYNLKTLLPLIRYYYNLTKEKVMINITQRGIMILPMDIDGTLIDIYIFPEL